MAKTLKRKRTSLKPKVKRLAPGTVSKKNKRGLLGLLKGKYKQLVPGDVFNLK